MSLDYSGMTVNERLIVSGLLKSYDKAVLKKNANEVRRILKQVGVDDSSINDIIIHLNL